MTPAGVIGHPAGLVVLLALVLYPGFAEQARVAQHAVGVDGRLGLRSAGALGRVGIQQSQLGAVGVGHPCPCSVIADARDVKDTGQQATRTQIGVCASERQKPLSVVTRKPVSSSRPKMDKCATAESVSRDQPCPHRGVRLSALIRTALNSDAAATEIDMPLQIGLFEAPAS